MSNQQSLGILLAQLSRDASTARAVYTQRKNVEGESVGVAGKTDQRVKKYFCIEFLDKEQEDTNEDLDFRALENGFGFKLTRKSLWRAIPKWQAVSANRHPSGGNFVPNQQSLGITLAQLSRDASAAGAARWLNTQRKNVEVESVGVAGKTDQRRKKYFCLEVAITPTSFSVNGELEIETSTSSWITAVLSKDDPVS